MQNPVHFRIARDHAALSALAEKVEGILETRNLPPKVVFAMQLAIDELVSNILNHSSKEFASSQIEVRLGFGEGGVEVEVESEGDCFNPFLAGEPALDQSLDDRPIGGLGVHLTRKTMDDCRFAYRNGRNIVTVQKKLSSADGSKDGADL